MKKLKLLGIMLLLIIAIEFIPNSTNLITESEIPKSSAQYEYNTRTLNNNTIIVANESVSTDVAITQLGRSQLALDKATDWTHETLLWNSTETFVDTTPSGQDYCDGMDSITQTFTPTAGSNYDASSTYAHTNTHVITDGSTTDSYNVIYSISNPTSQLLTWEWQFMFLNPTYSGELSFIEMYIGTGSDNCILAVHQSGGNFYLESWYSSAHHNLMTLSSSQWYHIQISQFSDVGAYVFCNGKYLSSVFFNGGVGGASNMLVCQYTVTGKGSLLVDAVDCSIADGYFNNRNLYRKLDATFYNLYPGTYYYQAKGTMESGDNYYTPIETLTITTSEIANTQLISESSHATQWRFTDYSVDRVLDREFTLNESHIQPDYINMIQTVNPSTVNDMINEDYSLINGKASDLTYHTYSLYHFPISQYAKIHSMTAYFDPQDSISNDVFASFSTYESDLWMNSINWNSYIADSIPETLLTTEVLSRIPSLKWNNVELETTEKSIIIKHLSNVDGYCRIINNPNNILHAIAYNNTQDLEMTNYEKSAVFINATKTIELNQYELLTIEFNSSAYCNAQFYLNNEFVKDLSSISGSFEYLLTDSLSSNQVNLSIIAEIPSYQTFSLKNLTILVGSQSDLYNMTLAPYSEKFQYIEPSFYTVLIYELDELVDVRGIQINMTDNIIIYGSSSLILNSLSFFDNSFRSLAFIAYSVNIQCYRRNLIVNETLSVNQFYSDLDSYVNITVRDGIYNNLVGSFSVLASEYQSLILNVYSLTIRNNMQFQTSLWINQSYYQEILANSEITLFLPSQEFNLTYLNDDLNRINQSTLIDLNRNIALQINSSQYSVYFAPFGIDFLGIEWNSVRFYINGGLRQFGMNFVRGSTCNITVKDFFNTVISSEIIAVNNITEYNIYVPVTLLELTNNYPFACIMKITRADITTYIFNQTIASGASLPFRFLSNQQYRIDIYCQENNSYLETKNVLLTEYRSLSFGFYETEIPVEPIESEPSYVVEFMITIWAFVGFIAIISIIALTTSKKREYKTRKSLELIYQGRLN